MRIGEKAEKLIEECEGWDNPWVWPQGASGITIGIGYDLGYEPFEKDWKGNLSPAVFEELLPAVGKRGQSASVIAKKFQGIRIPREAAQKVFRTITIPRYEAQTMAVFPGSEKLPPDAFGSLVSVVFNRGPLLDQSDRRREMVELHRLFATGAPGLDAVAKRVESMARLWADNKSSDGDLHDRRLKEAALIRSCIPHLR